MRKMKIKMKVKYLKRWNSSDYGYMTDLHLVFDPFYTTVSLVGKIDIDVDDEIDVELPDTVFPNRDDMLKVISINTNVHNNR